MKKVELLRELQIVESALDQRRERLKAIGELLADHQELAEAERASQDRQRELRKLEIEQTDLDLHLSELREKLEQVEGKLYGGSIRNPKELDSLSKESEQLRRAVSAQEDRLLACFERVEQAVEARDKAVRHREELTSERRGRDQHLAVEREQLEQEVSTLERDRDRLRGALDPASLRIFDQLRRSKGGVALVEAKQRTCQGCRITLTASQEQHVRASQDLELCQNCGRILHATL